MNSKKLIQSILSTAFLMGQQAYAEEAVTQLQDLSREELIEIAIVQLNSYGDGEVELRLEDWDEYDAPLLMEMVQEIVEYNRFQSMPPDLKKMLNNIVRVED